MNKLDVKLEKSMSRYMEEEIFSIGHFEVSIANPNSYFPDVLTEENLQRFLFECRKRYDENFLQLAELSRLSFLFVSSLELKKEFMTMGSASIVNYEAGATRPNESKIILLSKIFQVTPDLLKGTAFQQGNTTAYAAFQLKMDELQAKPLEQREFLLEHIYQMNTDLLHYAVEAVYKKTLDRF